MRLGGMCHETASTPIARQQIQMANDAPSTILDLIKASAIFVINMQDSQIFFAWWER